MHLPAAQTHSQCVKSPHFWAPYTCCALSTRLHPIAHCKSRKSRRKISSCRPLPSWGKMGETKELLTAVQAGPVPSTHSWHSGHSTYRTEGACARAGQAIGGMRSSKPLCRRAVHTQRCLPTRGGLSPAARLHGTCKPCSKGRAGDCEGDQGLACQPAQAQPPKWRE